MQIDWFTFAAQVVNFLVLVWLMKRFLYGPILAAIAEREATIQASIESAVAREQAAEASRKSFEDQQAAMEHLRESMRAEAARDTEVWRQERLQELRTEVSQTRAAWQATIAREQGQFLRDLRERTARQVLEIARHVLLELAECNLEGQVIQAFLSHLDQLLDRQGLVESSTQENSHLVVRTAFPLSAEATQRTTDALTSRLGNRRLKFEVEASLICGIELVLGDHKLQWNVDQYLSSLEQSVMSALHQPSAHRFTPDPEAV